MKADFKNILLLILALMTVTSAALAGPDPTNPPDEGYRRDDLSISYTCDGENEWYAVARFKNDLSGDPRLFFVFKEKYTYITDLESESSESMRFHRGSEFLSYTLNKTTNVLTLTNRNGLWVVDVPCVQVSE